jgi:hypothetical protein
MAHWHSGRSNGGLGGQIRFLRKVLGAQQKLHLSLVLQAKICACPVVLELDIVKHKCRSFNKRACVTCTGNGSKRTFDVGNDKIVER